MWLKQHGTRACTLYLLSVVSRSVLSTLWDPMDCSQLDSVHRVSQNQEYWNGLQFFLQIIFPHSRSWTQISSLQGWTYLPLSEGSPFNLGLEPPFSQDYYSRTKLISAHLLPPPIKPPIPFPDFTFLNCNLVPLRIHELKLRSVGDTLLPYFLNTTITLLWADFSLIYFSRDFIPSCLDYTVVCANYTPHLFMWSNNFSNIIFKLSFLNIIFKLSFANHIFHLTLPLEKLWILIVHEIELKLYNWVLHSYDRSFSFSTFWYTFFHSSLFSLYKYYRLIWHFPIFIFYDVPKAVYYFFLTTFRIFICLNHTPWSMHHLKSTDLGVRNSLMSALQKF